MEIIFHRGFSEWVRKIVTGVYLHHLHSIVGNMLSNKMVAKRHGFLFCSDTSILCLEHHTHVFLKYMCGFVYLDLH